MPSIPQNTRLNLIQTEVPGASIPTQRFGAVGGAIENIGQRMARIGEELIVKRKQAIDTDFARTRAIKASDSISQFEQETKATLGPDGAGYEEKMKEFAQEQYKKDIEEAPSEEAKMLYDQHAQSRFAGAIIDARGFENTQRIKYMDTTNQELEKTIGLNQAANPNIEKAIYDSEQLKTKIQEQVLSGVYDPQMAERRIKSVSASTADGLFAGLKSQRTVESADVALGYLNDVNNPITKGLDPKELGAYKEAFTSQKEHVIKEKTHELGGKIDNFAAAAVRGMGASKQLGDTLLVDAQTLLSKDSKEYKEMAFKIGTSLTVGNFMKSAENMSPDKQLKEAENIGNKIMKYIPEGENYTYMAAYKDILVSKVKAEAANNYDKAHKDPVAYAMNNPTVKRAWEQAGNDPGKTQDAINKQMAHLKNMNLPQKVLSKQMSANLTSFIEQQPDPQSRAAALEIKKNQFGPYWQSAFHEAVKDSHLDAGYFIASMVDDKNARNALVSNIVNGKGIKENFVADDARKAKLGTIENEVAKQMSTVSAALYPNSQLGESVNITNSFQKNVEYEAMKLVTYSNKDPKDAAKEAFDKLVGSTFHIINDKSSSPIMAPMKVGNIDTVPEYIRAFADEYSKPANLKSFDIHPDYNLEKIGAYGVWVTNSDQTGLRLMGRTRAGEFKNIIDSKGNPVEKSFADISTTLDKTILDAAERNRSVFKRIFTPSANTNELGSRPGAMR